MAVHDRHDRPARPARRSGVLRATLTIVLTLFLAGIVACSGGSEERGSDDGSRPNAPDAQSAPDTPGDSSIGPDSGAGLNQDHTDRAPSDVGDVERPADGGISPIAPPPLVGDEVTAPTATAIPANGLTPDSTVTPGPAIDDGINPDPTATPGPSIADGFTPDPTTTPDRASNDERVYSCLIDDDHETLEQSESPSAPPVPANETVISIDGDASDWADRPTVTVDPGDDSEAGFPDLGTVRAFRNENAVYLAAEVGEYSAEFDSIETYVESGDREIFIGWSPLGEYGWAADISDGWADLGALKRSSFAIGSDFEARIDLRDLGSPGSLTVVRTQVMAGECCGPTWRAVDLFELGDPVPAVAEVDPEWRLVPEGGAREARFMLATPDTRAIDIAFDPVDERALVTGSAGAVPPNSQVLVGNIELNDFIMLRADIDGAFSTDVAAVQGTHVLVKQDTTNTFIREDRQTFSENVIAPGVLIQIPVTRATDGVAFSAGARPCCGEEGIAPFTVAGTLETDRVNAGGRARISGVVTVFAGPTAGPRDQGLELQLTLLGDGGGRQVGRAGKFISPFLTPTGLPIERTLHGSPPGTSKRRISRNSIPLRWSPLDRRF